MHLPAVLHCRLPNCLLHLAGGFRLAQLGSKDGPAAIKHHGSEGRIGPAAGSPECQTLLSELPIFELLEKVASLTRSPATAGFGGSHTHIYIYLSLSSLSLSLKSMHPHIFTGKYYANT